VSTRYHQNLQGKRLVAACFTIADRRPERPSSARGRARREIGTL